VGVSPNNTWGYGLAKLPSLPPGAPANVSAVAGNGSATVTWDPPASDGGSPITQYSVTSDPASSTEVVDGSTTTVEVTGLTNGVSYTFRVRASNAVGDGPLSSASNAVTPLAPPTPTPTPSATPTPAATPSPTPTATPTATPAPTPTPTATSTPTPTRTPTPTPVPGTSLPGLGALAAAFAGLTLLFVWRARRRETGLG
jgi:hypothetical protein